MSHLCAGCQSYSILTELCGVSPPTLPSSLSSQEQVSPLKLYYRVGTWGGGVLCMVAQETSLQSPRFAEEMSPALGRKGAAFEFLFNHIWLT